MESVIHPSASMARGHAQEQVTRGIGLAALAMLIVALALVFLVAPTGDARSGGEAQRIKLAAELSRNSIGNTLYILDEPTTGLHLYDVEKLIKVLYQLVERGNTVVIIEHNLEVLKHCQYIIDLGPDGGEKGGELVYQGEIDGIVKEKRSWTGKYLKGLI